MLLSRNSQGRGLEYYKMLKEAGWQAIDINETCDPSKFYEYSEEAYNYVKEVIKNITDAGLIVGQCHAPMAEWYNGKTEEEIERRIVSVVNCTRIAGELNIPCTIMHPFIYSWSEDDPDPERTFNLNAEYLKRVCAVAGNTRVCLENMPGYHGFITNGTEMKKMLEAVGENLYVCVDTGHAASNRVKMSDFAENVGEKIIALHVHDSLLGADKHVLPYTGDFDWQDFKEFLKSYKGTLNSETSFSVKLPNERRLEWETCERKVFETLMM